MSRKSARTLAIVLVAVGVVLIAIGLMYFTVAADKLPAFLGQVHHASAHRTKRGIASLILGVASLGGAWFAFARVTRRHYASA
jgi:amino acid permease